MSKVLYIAIAILVSVAAALVLVKGKDSQRSSIQVKGPSSSQANEKREKLRNFDAQIVANANEFLADGRATFRFDNLATKCFGVTRFSFTRRLKVRIWEASGRESVRAPR